jgi:hypothetical protein
VLLDQPRARDERLDRRQRLVVAADRLAVALEREQLGGLRLERQLVHVGGVPDRDGQRRMLGHVRDACAVHVHRALVPQAGAELLSGAQRHADLLR